MLEPKFDHRKIEKRIYEMWESGGYFTATRDPEKKPYTILLPPPNASGKMHTGNVLMIAIEDLLIRWKRMQGYSALYVPGTDHAGFETQTTYERELKKEGKSRLDFDRNTLYQMIWDFVQKNKNMIENQIREMGASVDWSRYTFTLDRKALDITLDTFKKMESEGLIYRADYIVNYSFKWGTTFSDAEIQYAEKTTPLYYVKYRLRNRSADEPEYLSVATVRPELVFIDTHLEVNQKDKKKNKWIGRKLVNPLAGHEMEIIADEFVDPKFGTGLVKLTPAHDKNDYAIGIKHKIPILGVIGLDGRIENKSGSFSKYNGLTILESRKKAVEDLSAGGAIGKVDENYKHVIPVDYRTGDYVENLVLPNWFVKVETLKKPAYEAVKSSTIKIYPKWRELTYLRWIESMRDWPISRQTVWGIRVPAWYDVKKNPSLTVTFLNKDIKTVSGQIGELLKQYSLEEIKTGLQKIIASKECSYEVSEEKPGENFLPDTDTFDTWFSSGQWPFTTLKYPDSEDYKYFYPTAVLETGWEIVTRWVSRMIMFGYYLTGREPFKEVYLHGHVRALDGKKMSKSLGNVINPDDYISEFGVDALRMGMISGTANGKDFNFPRDKVIAYRNFANKIWNMARFMLMMEEKFLADSGSGESSRKAPSFENAKSLEKEFRGKLSAEDKEIMKGLDKLIIEVNRNLEKYRMADAGNAIYQFMWHELADKYIELVKKREDLDDKAAALGVLRYMYTTCLKLLHPFMPFITEEIWGSINVSKEKPLIVTDWPV